MSSKASPSDSNGGVASQRSKLQALSEMTLIVADTGDLEAVKRSRPQDCTTNPSLMLKAAGTEAGQLLLTESIAWARARATGTEEQLAHAACDRFASLLGRELSRIVPGLVSIEVDADLSFDTAATVQKGQAIIASMAELGVPKERILIKVAATWEGIQAARTLKEAGIECNITLIFSKVQALAASQVGAFLISPFVGRVTDWYMKGRTEPFSIDQDPGVILVRDIYRTFKAIGSKTVVMGASFRTVAQIEALAGCDRLTISPALIDALASEQGDLPRRLTPDLPPEQPPAAISESTFRRLLNDDAMATEKLSEGIRQFSADLMKMRDLVRTHIGR